MMFNALFGLIAGKLWIPGILGVGGYLLGWLDAKEFWWKGRIGKMTRWLHKKLLPYN